MIVVALHSLTFFLSSSIFFFFSSRISFSYSRPCAVQSLPCSFPLSSSRTYLTLHEIKTLDIFEGTTRSVNSHSSSSRLWLSTKPSCSMCDRSCRFICQTYVLSISKVHVNTSNNWYNVLVQMDWLVYCLSVLCNFNSPFESFDRIISQFQCNSINLWMDDQRIRMFEWSFRILFIPR